jgi:uncharacterized cupin superfamily protein
MSEPSSSRRHPFVVNHRDQPTREIKVGERYGAKLTPLAQSAGAKALGANITEVLPGRAAFPRHFHCATEEAMYVLEGEGTVRLGDDTFTVGPGDWVSFPIGPAGAHQVVNHGKEPLRFLGLSNRVTADVVGYPDSKKIGASGAPPGAMWTDPPWVRAIFPEEAQVDYYHRDVVDEKP